MRKKTKDKYSMESVSVPENYNEMTSKDREDICLGLLETIYDIIIKSTNTEYSKLDLIYKILDSTLTHHEKLEEYEVCSLIRDTRKILDEQKDK